MSSPGVARPAGVSRRGVSLLAGPGAINLAVNATATVFSNGNRNACATVANVGKSAVTLATVGGTTSTIDVPAGATGTLCKAAMTTVNLTCIGTDVCTSQWRVDDN